MRSDDAVETFKRHADYHISAAQKGRISHEDPHSTVPLL